jgi:hypothetical protein
VTPRAIVALALILAGIGVGIFLAPARTFNGYTLLAGGLVAVGILVHSRSEV